MSRIILQLDPSEPKMWVAQQPPQTPVQVQVPTSHAGFKVLGETLDKDGVGIGIGIATLIFFGSIMSILAWAAIQLVKNLNPAKIAMEVSHYIKETECKLERIDLNTLNSDRKIELLTSIAEKNAAMLREARAAGLEMSGQLHQIQRAVDTAIKTEIAKK